MTDKAAERHILSPKEPDHVWTVSDVLNAARAEDVEFLVKAANEYAALARVRAAAKEYVTAYDAPYVGGDDDRDDEADGARNRLREALRAAPY